MGQKKPGGAAGSPGPEGAEAEMGRAHPPPHPAAQEWGLGPPPAAGVPDRPRLPFDAAHHLEFLQIPEADGPAKEARLCREARFSQDLTAQVRATKSNARGQGLALCRPWEGIWHMGSEHRPWIQTGREGPGHWVREIRVGEGGDPGPILTGGQFSLHRIIRHMTPWAGDILRTGIRAGQRGEGRQSRATGPAPPLTCLSCQKPGGTHWGGTPPR